MNYDFFAKDCKKEIVANIAINLKFRVTSEQTTIIIDPKKIP